MFSSNSSSFDNPNEGRTLSLIESFHWLLKHHLNPPSSILVPQIQNLFRESTQEEIQYALEYGFLLHTLLLNIQTPPMMTNDNSVVEEIVKLILSYGKQILLWQRDCNGSLPLHLACSCPIPNQQIIKLLLLDNDDSQVNNQSAVLATDKYGYTPIHHVCNHKADVVSSNFNDSLLEIFQLILSYDRENTSLGMQTILCDYPLHIACRIGAPIPIIKLLLSYDGKTLWEKNRFLNLPIHLACGHHAVSPDTVRLLLENDKLKMTIHQKDDFGRLPLHVACCFRAPIETIKLLLDEDCTNYSIHEQDNNGYLPIHHACNNTADSANIHYNLEAIRMLLERDATKVKASLFARTNVGYFDPLQLSFENQKPSIEIIQFLLTSMERESSLLYAINWSGYLQRLRLCYPRLMLQVLARINVDNRLIVPRWKTHIYDFIEQVPDNHYTNTYTSNDVVDGVYHAWSDLQISHRNTIVAKINLYEQLESYGPLLEMIVWRAYCIAASTSTQLNDDPVRAITKPLFKDMDPSYKTKCLFRCGANVIVLKVLSFLDTVERLT